MFVTEHWNECDSDLEADFCTTTTNNDPPALQLLEQADEEIHRDHQAFIWWIVAFTCVFQTLHSLSSRAVGWLLLLFGSLLSYLGLFSDEIAKIAQAFPSTLHLREQYLREKLNTSPIKRYVVCPTCLSLYNYHQCLEGHIRLQVIKMCPECLQSKKRIPLLREVITRTDKKKYYPFLTFPYASLVQSLQSLFNRPGFYQQCEQWRHNLTTGISLHDVYDGRIWKSFLHHNGKPFLAEKKQLSVHAEHRLVSTI